MAGAISIEKSVEVMEKTFTILKQELNAEEYLIYLQVITPRTGDATRELREKTEGLGLQEVFDGAKSVERLRGGGRRWWGYRVRYVEGVGMVVERVVR